MGFEPTVPSGITGFQDQLLKPLGHLSMRFSCFFLSSDLDYYILPSTGCQEVFYSFFKILFEVFLQPLRHVSVSLAVICILQEKSKTVNPFFHIFFNLFFLHYIYRNSNSMYMVFICKPCYNKLQSIHHERSICHETRFQTFLNIRKTSHNLR